MRKSFSFLTMLLVAFLSICATAQSSAQSINSKLVSTWVGDKISLDDEGLTGFMTPVMAFKADGSGSYSFKITANIDIEGTESSKIRVSMAGNTPCTWTLDDEGVLHAYFDREKFHMNISEKCFEVEPNDKEAAEYLKTYKNELIQILENFKTEMVEILPDYSTWTDISIVGAKLYMTDCDGIKQTFTRGYTKSPAKNKTTKGKSKTKAKASKKSKTKSKSKSTNSYSI